MHMKTAITLFWIWLLSFPVLLSAQELTHVTIENLVAGGLKDSLNADQQKSVQSLILTGSMNKDDFYFIRDHLKGLNELDMEEVDVDTIPEKAFWQGDFFDFDPNKSYLAFSKVILPKSLIFIGDKAFFSAIKFGCKLIITGSFPSLGDRVFDCLHYDDFNDRYYNLIPSDDNPYCKILDGDIYSTDGKVIYYGIYPYKILDGTEEIAPRAFCERRIDNVYIPASVKKIGDKAFANIEQPFMVVAAQDTYFAPSIVCYCTDLPQLGKSVFNHDGSKDWSFDLYVPDKVVEKYLSALQWNEFDGIYGLSQFEPYRPDLSNVENVKKDSFRISYYSDRLDVESSQVIDKIEVLNLNGQIIYQKKISDTKGNVFFIDLEPSVIGILKVTYVSGKEEYAKIKMN